jgi:hypothetical protein
MQSDAPAETEKKTENIFSRSVGGNHEKRSARARWGNYAGLFSDGFLVVPYKFLRSYAALQPPLSNGEVLFILQLMTFKWEEAAPYPSYKTLARLMGVDEKTVQRHAQSLCRKKYLYRIFQPKGTNRFDLTNLFAAIARAESIPVKRAHAVAPDGEGTDME